MLEPLAAAFAASLRPGDWLGVLPVYDAGGTTDRSIGSDALLHALEARGVRNAALGADIDAAFEALASRDGDGAALLVCGARGPDLPRLARRLAAPSR
jgi:UDP-N-acetylmuramate-alanine ligase